MPRKIEYDFPVHRLNRATGAGFALLLFTVGFLALMLTSIAGAQVNGMPASVTSPGFGGRQVNGVPPSVTSLGPRGYTPFVPTCCFTGTSLGSPHFVANPNSALNFHHHHHNGSLPWGGAAYAVPYYGYYDSGEEVADNPPDDQYNGGPTVFDRRGPGIAPSQPSAPYPSRSRSDNMPPEPASDAAAQSDAAPAPDQPQTVLVFKDGHQLEVANYAIVGSTLYDLTGGRRQKIALADLDLTATAKLNDDRGIDFQVPAAPEAN
jgi:hypothetical protein